MWFATQGASRRLDRDGRWQTFTTVDGLAENDVWAIAIDPGTGDKWFGTYGGGVNRLTTDGRWQTIVVGRRVR